MDNISSPQPIDVTAALIAHNGRLFIAQRPPWKKFGLRWEFPGGKIEPGEDRENALIREIREELCLDVAVRGFFRSASYREADFAINLHAYWCAVTGGRFRLREHPSYRWAMPAELWEIDLTSADRLLIPYLQELAELPEYSSSLSHCGLNDLMFY